MTRPRGFLDALMRAYGSPLYTYDLAEVERRAAELFAAFPAGSSLLYSLKANPLPALVEQAIRSGAAAEVSSTGELGVALAAGCAPGRVLYTGPGKTSAEIAAALAAGVTRFSVESFTDLDRVANAGAGAGVRPEVLLRVNPAIAPRARLAMTGVPSQFGFEESELAASASRLRQLSVDVLGVHVFFGTQIAGVDGLASAAGAAIDVAERLAESLDLRFRVLDLGGGFPWPYGGVGGRTDLTGLAERLAEVSAARRLTAGAELWFESGRYLSASSGELWATVLDVKVSKGRRFVLLDTGIHHLGGMSGLGRIPQVAFAFERDGLPAEAAPEAASEAAPNAEPVTIVGPLCSPLDCLVRSASLPAIEPGAVLVLRDVGAYGLTASLTGFLSRDPPVEVAHRDGAFVSAHQLRAGHRPVHPTPLSTRSPEDTKNAD